MTAGLRPLASQDPHLLGAEVAAEAADGRFGAPASTIAESADWLTDLAVERCPFAGGSDDACDWILDFSAAFCLAAGTPSPF